MSTWENNNHWGQDVSTLQLPHHCSIGPQVLPSHLRKGSSIVNSTIHSVMGTSPVHVLNGIEQTAALLITPRWMKIRCAHYFPNIGRFSDLCGPFLLWYFCLFLIYPFSFGPQWCCRFTILYLPYLCLSEPHLLGFSLSGISHEQIAWIFALFCS